MKASETSGVALIAPASLGDLVDRHGGLLDDGLDRALVVRRIGPSDHAGAFELAPVLHARGAARCTTSAAVLLVAQSVASSVGQGRRWVHPEADAVLAALLAAVEEPVFDLVEQGVRIAEGAFIDRGAVLGPGCVVYPGVHVGRDVVIGAGSVVGRPGFGFVDRGEGAPPLRMPHRAGVVLHEGVELGPLCTVDAGVLSPTTIGAHTKIDAQVHLGHGVVIGRGCRIAAQVGFAGSVVVEDDVRIGGQAGIADHVRIGRGARIAAKAGVIGDVPAGAVFAGYPAVARARWLRGHARLYRR
ncbi:MAG: UDP-3-O-(3-hydroxymyristoyl)glucosamine N-acyltransferase [Polyangiales bacterium]